MSKFDKATTAFALNLLHQVAKENENAFFSPTSITLSLAMCYAGSDGNTKTQMRQHLFGDVDDGELQANLEKLVSTLNEPNQAVQLNTANRLYCQKDFQILQQYRDILQKSYRSGIFSVDFAAQAEKARQEINDWVSQTTHEKIKNLIPERMLDAATRLVLVNALYFKAEWATKFKKDFTVKKSFHVTSTKSVDVDMMRQTDRFHYFEDDKCQMLSLPYLTYKVKMIVILPKDKRGLEKLEQDMTATYWCNLMQSMNSCRVNVEIPKMKLEQTFELNDALKAIGVTHAFEATKADFSNITGNKELFISKVLHKSFIEVNEDGTEAAAATAILMLAGCCPPAKVDPPKDFIADHPFLFAIVNNDDTNAILFLGHYYGSAS